ncbi:MAG: SdrD B-like domain-containing protein, partial [Pirellulales bacterium]
VFRDDGVFSANLTVTDEDGGEVSGWFDVQVDNVAPNFVVTGSDETLLPDKRGLLQRTVTFTDPGEDDWFGTVDFGDGTGAQPLTIDPVNKVITLDHTYTASDTFVVTVTLDDGDGGTDTDSFEVTVILAEVEFRQATFTDSEGIGTSMVVELERTPAGTNVTSQVLVEINGGTAVGGGVDYDDSAFLPAGLLVTFNPGDTIVSVPIPIRSDNLVELEETIHFKVTSVSNALIRPQDTAALTIANDDTARMVITDVSLSETDSGTTAFDFTVKVDKVASHDITALVNTNGVSATGGGTDYADLVDTLITIPAGSASTTVTVEVMGEQLVEPHEVFEVNLSNARFNGVADATRATIDIGLARGLINNDDFLAGRVFNDLDNDGAYELADGDQGIRDVRMELWDSALTSLFDFDNTTTDGTYKFNVTLPAGTFKILEVVDELADLGLLDGKETADVNGGAVDNAQNSNTIADIAVGGITPVAATVDYLFAEIEPSDLFGTVWRDFNDDGEINFGEVGIQGVDILLTGTDDRGNAVNEPAQTDDNGAYAVINLRPGTYKVEESQPAEFDDGRESGDFEVTTLPVNAAAINSGINSANDEFSGIMLAPGSTGDFYNFGERPQAGDPVGANSTATIGFWQNKNGQALIEGLNGDAKSTLLGRWLAVTFPEMYGSGATYVGANGDSVSMDLTNASNEQVGAIFKFLHRRNKKSAVENGGAPKIDAQVMAVALAAYSTSENLIGLNFNATNGPGAPLYDFADVSNDGTFDPGDGDVAILNSVNITRVRSFGFTTSQDGIAYQRFNVLSVLTLSEANVLGVALDADGRATIIDILSSTNALTNSGFLYDENSSGLIDTSIETTLRNLANELYTAINEGSDI